jgi:hypothetical protein
MAMSFIADQTVAPDAARRKTKDASAKGGAESF